MKTTYCKRCRKPVGLMICTHCMGISNVTINWPSIFHQIVRVPDMAELNEYLEKWYGGPKTGSPIRKA